MVTTAFLILFGKVFVLFSKTFNLGNGSTWPGHIALKANKNFIKDIVRKNQGVIPVQTGIQKNAGSPIGSGMTKGKNLKTIFVVGTNGKTTTTKMIRTILERSGKKVFQNEAGANLMNGVASTFLLNANLNGKIKADYAIFEIDENSLPLVLQELIPDYIIVLNLFRDQLDRYGEVNIIATKWDRALDPLPETTTILLNADDPQIAYLAKDSNPKVKYFGLTEEDAPKEKTHQVLDSNYCPNCGHKLTYKKIFFSHLGIWSCDGCGRKRPFVDGDSSPIYPLPGLYNKYNTNAAALLAKCLGVSDKEISDALSNFNPAFGRQESVSIRNKSVQIFLSKNPTSFNESLRTIHELKGKHILFVLNDRIPDGRDVSWIWDTALEEFVNDFQNVIVSGDRAYDMGLRVKYSSNEFKIQNSKFKIENDLGNAIESSLKDTPANATLFVLPTYSAMLEVRKILTGRRIL